MNCHIINLHNISSQYTRAGVLGVPNTAGELEDNSRTKRGKITNGIKYSLKETLEGFKNISKFSAPASRSAQGG